MYKNQLQELAQRSCFNLPSYTSIREGPDHAPRFKAVVNFNGETFESPSYCSTLRQAEHSAAEVALNALASRGPSNSLAARILDETGVYKNLLQEVSQRVGASLPAYTTFRTGLGHLPVFTCTVELANVIFTGEPAKNKKQAEKNAAMAAWLSLKSLVQQTETPYEKAHKDEQEHVTVARALQKYLNKARMERLSFPIKFPALNPRPSTTQQSPVTSSKILPLICPKTSHHRHRPISPATFQKIIKTTQTQPNETRSSKKLVFPAAAAGAPPYIPVRHCRIAPPVTIRNTIPVFSAPPQPSLVMRQQPPLGMAPPVCVRQAVPVFAAPVPIKTEDSAASRSSSLFPKVNMVRVEEPFGFKPLPVSAVPNPAVPTIQVEPASAEVPTTQLESPPVPKVSTSSPPASSEASAEETENAAIEELKDLKI